MTVVALATIAVAPAITPTVARAASTKTTGGVGLRLLDAPVTARGDPRAQIYIVDHVAPGTVIHRHFEVSNSTAATAHVVVYPAAASIANGSFLGGAGHTPNELSTWTSVRPGASAVAAGGHLTATVIITVPRYASPGERYGVVWAEVRSAPSLAAAVTQISRVGIRVYLSVGPGGSPAADFNIDSLTALRSPDGQPTVVATVHNTGGRALDMNGSLRLSAGPGGVSAGPFSATLGTTLAIGATEAVTIVLDKQLPAGPWDARVVLRSGLISRAAQATITFPEFGTSLPTATKSSGPGQVYVALAALLGLLAGAATFVLRRRRRPTGTRTKESRMSATEHVQQLKPVGDQPARIVSLRSRWNRAFALLTIMVLLSGLAGLLGTRLLVDNFRGSAVEAEQESTSSARLRAEVVAYSILVASPITVAQQRQLLAAQRTIQDDYTQAIAREDTTSARKLLAKSLVRWQSIVTAAGTPDHPADLVVRGAVVTTRAPEVLELLDRAGAANRVAVRDQLAGAARTERDTMAALALLLLLAILLALRLARRLSTEVLRPVGILRDSANHLAAGELEHRVVVDRTDELGELASSFNAMADSIAGSQRSLTREANTDSLSGLPNRAAFGTRLAASLGRPNRRDGTQAVLFVDLDDFKDVNDTLGHAAGDVLLRVVAGRLSDAIRPGDLVARLGGDEFAILLEDLPDSGLALTVAKRIVKALAEPVQLGVNAVHVGASVGLAMRHQHSTFDGLMREADIAMYAAKGKGKNRVEQYDVGLDDLAAARHELKADLAGAADRGELVLDYQPIVDLNTGLLAGLEALVRWQHPTRGLLPPSTFIEVAEETGDIMDIGAFVLETAARQARQWQRRYQLPELLISVNVSVCQLDRPGFAADFEKLLRSTRLDPATLIVEVTESILADPGGEAAAALAALRRVGVRVALDDFGTGYSSISYLRQLPADILKIDRSFLAGTFAGSPGQALLEAIVAMANSLGLDVIPEGIEEIDQLSRLRAMGCTLGQGFLLSRPVPAEVVDALLAAPMPLPHIGLHDAGDRALAVSLRPAEVDGDASLRRGSSAHADTAGPNRLPGSWNHRR